MQCHIGHVGHLPGVAGALRSCWYAGVARPLRPFWHAVFWEICVDICTNTHARFPRSATCQATRVARPRDHIGYISHLPGFAEALRPCWVCSDHIDSISYLPGVAGSPRPCWVCRGCETPAPSEMQFFGEICVHTCTNSHARFRRSATCQATWRHPGGKASRPY